MDPEDDPEEEEEDGGAQDIDATRQAKSAVMKTSTRQVIMLRWSLIMSFFGQSTRQKLFGLAIGLSGSNIGHKCTSCFFNVFMALPFGNVSHKHGVVLRQILGCIAEGQYGQANQGQALPCQEQTTQGVRTELVTLR